MTERERVIQLSAAAAVAIVCEQLVALDVAAQATLTEQIIERARHLEYESRVQVGGIGAIAAADVLRQLGRR